MSSSYVPERGDLVWLEFTPQAGSEQRGRRPALVLSPKAYNEKVGLALFCPVTSKIKGYPFEVQLPDGYVVSGVVPGLIQSVSQARWPELQVLGSLSGLAPSLCPKPPLLQPISI